MATAPSEQLCWCLLYCLDQSDDEARSQEANIRLAVQVEEMEAFEAGGV